MSERVLESVREQYRYELLTWPEINEAVAMKKVVLLPVGATEQHGPHLPLDTDFKLALHSGPGSEGHRNGSHIDTTIGNGGGAHLSIETFSGDVRIQRR